MAKKHSTEMSAQKENFLKITSSNENEGDSTEGMMLPIVSLQKKRLIHHVTRGLDQ